MSSIALICHACSGIAVRVQVLARKYGSILRGMLGSAVTVVRFDDSTHPTSVPQFGNVELYDTLTSPTQFYSRRCSVLLLLLLQVHGYRIELVCDIGSKQMNRVMNVLY